MRSLKFHNDFFSPLRGLRVLKLRYLQITDVPISVGYLEQLRYLDLSHNHFKALPNSICRLYNLQTLRLEGCSEFKEWPRDITKMVSLRHLQCPFIKYMPRGLGQLSSLQTLFYFVVSDQIRRRRSGGIGELHGLNQLRQNLDIRDLRNVRDARDAKEANLKDKSELQSLRLHWGYTRDNRRRRSSVEEQVLENLQPHQNLKALSIEYYQGIKMPRWMLHSSYSLLGLPNLVELEIMRCHKLICLPLVGEFPCLRRLHLLNLEALESISNKVVMTERGNNNNNNNEGRGREGGQEGKPLLMVPFPMLQQLSLSSMPNLERWTISVGEEEEAQQNNHLHFVPSMFRRLIHLELQYCKKLTTVPMLSVEGMQQLTSLRTLKLEYLDKLVSLPDFPAPATLELLHIIDCPSLVRLPDCFFDNLKLLSEFEILNCNELTSLPQGIQHLIALKRLKIGQCSNLSSLPQGIQKLTALIDLNISTCPSLKILPDLGGLSSLQRLEIENCSNLSSIPEGIRHLTSLKTVRFCRCPGLKALPYGFGSLSSLQELRIQDCSNLSSLPEGNWNLTSLKTLNIWKCPILNTLSDGLGSLSSLQVLQIHGSSNLSSLSEGIRHLTALKELRISECPGLKTLPEGMGNLSSLQQLEIRDCSNLLSLPEGIPHLIALKYLGISKCPGLKTLPNGFGSLLSLESLHIYHCSNLLSLPEGIQHLPALHRLSINNCPCLRSLPGGLASRGALDISNCPNLSLSWVGGVVKY